MPPNDSYSLLLMLHLSISNVKPCGAVCQLIRSEPWPEQGLNLNVWLKYIKELGKKLRHYGGAC
jgi:hypothetical protein